MPDNLKQLYSASKIAKLENMERLGEITRGDIIQPEDKLLPIAAPNITGNYPSPVDPLSKYKGYIETPETILEDTDINQLRAEGQPGTEQAWNTMKRLIPATVFGAVSNLASMVDFEDYLNADEEFGNPVQQAMDSMTKWVTDQTPIYRKHPSESFDFGDSGYIWDNISQLANSVGAFTLSGIISGRILSSVSRLLTGPKAIAALEQAAITKAGKLVQAGELETKLVPQFIDNFISKKLYTGPTIINALATNQAENVMEGVGTYKDIYDMKLREGHSVNDAKRLASDATDVGSTINRLNFFMNLTSAGLFTGAKGALERAWGGTAKTIIAESGQEALGEGINYIAQTTSMLQAKQGDEFNYNLRREISRLGETQGLESMMLGAIGGAGQTAITHYVVPAAEVAKQKVKDSIEDIKRAAGLSGKRSVVDKLDDAYKYNLKDISDYISRDDFDENIDGYSNSFAISAIAGDATDSTPGQPINLKNTAQKLEMLKKVVDSKESTPEMKNRATSAINAIGTISKIAETSNLAGTENAGKLLSHIVTLNAIDSRIGEVNAEITKQTTQPQNINGGVIDSKTLLINTKKLNDELVELNNMRELTKRGYDNELAQIENIQKQREVKRAELEAAIVSNNAKKNSVNADSHDGDKIIKRDDGSTEIVNNSISKVIDNNTIPTIKSGTHATISDMYGLRGPSPEISHIDENGTKIIDKEEDTGKSSNNMLGAEQFRNLTNSEFDYENPTLHLLKEVDETSGDSNYFIVENNPSSDTFSISKLKNVTSDQDALLASAVRVIAKDGSIQTVLKLKDNNKVKHTESTNKASLIIGNTIVGNDVLTDVLGRVSKNENVNIVAEFTSRGMPINGVTDIAAELNDNIAELNDNIAGLNDNIAGLNDNIAGQETGGKSKKATTPATSKSNLARIINDDIRSKTLLGGTPKSKGGKKRISAIAINYLALLYSYIKGPKNEWIMIDDPDGINEAFLPNSDLNITKDAKLSIEVVQGTVKTTVRDKNGNAVISADGKVVTRDTSANEAIVNGTEIPIAIYAILKSGEKKLLGFLPELAWLNERNIETGERVHIAPADEKSANTEQKILNDIETVKSVREEFTKQFKDGKKSFSIKSDITNIGSGILYSIGIPENINKIVPELENDVEISTGSKSNMWASIDRGGNAIGFDRSIVPGSIMTSLPSGTPVVMVPTANGLLSPEIAVATKIPSKVALSMIDALELLMDGDRGNVLYNLGVRYWKRRGISIEGKGNKELSRQGVREYITQFVEVSRTGTTPITLHMNNGVIEIHWRHAGKPQEIIEGKKWSNESINNFVSDVSELDYNFALDLLAADNNKDINSDIIFINENHSSSILYKSANEFYKTTRSVKFKSAGKVGVGPANRNVYFIQPVLEFSLDSFGSDISTKNNNPKPTTFIEKSVENSIEKKNLDIVERYIKEKPNYPYLDKKELEWEKNIGVYSLPDDVRRALVSSNPEYALFLVRAEYDGLLYRQPAPIPAKTRRSVIPKVVRAGNEVSVTDASFVVETESVAPDVAISFGKREGFAQQVTFEEIQEEYSPEDKGKDNNIKCKT